MFNNIKTIFRKHKYDLNNPIPMETDIWCHDNWLMYNKYFCTECGESLSLELWQMEDLPWSMSHGCKGKRHKGEEKKERETIDSNKPLLAINSDNDNIVNIILILTIIINIVLIFVVILT